jgi:hypothetical protein
MGGLTRRFPGMARFGSGMAVLCAVHCLALPFLAATLSVSAQAHNSFLAHPVVEGGLLGTAAFIGYATLGHAYLVHRRATPLLLLTVGLALMVAGHFLAHGPVGLVGTVVGALMLVGAQVVNRRCPAACCAHGDSIVR